jgi:hypothetical protein
MFPIHQVLYCIESGDDRFPNAIVVANRRLLSYRRPQALVDQSTVIEKVNDGIILDQTPSDDTCLRRRQVLLIAQPEPPSLYRTCCLPRRRRWSRRYCFLPFDETVLSMWISAVVLLVRVRPRWSLSQRAGRFSR